MKTALITLILSLTAVQASARTPIPTFRIYECESVHKGPDHGTEVLLEVVRGQHQLVITSLTIAGAKTVVEKARRVLPPKGMLGAPIRYVGQNHTLTVNGTVAPSENGGRPGTLAHNRLKIAPTRLECQSVR